MERREVEGLIPPSSSPHCITWLPSCEGALVGVRTLAQAPDMCQEMGRLLDKLLDIALADVRVDVIVALFSQIGCLGQCGTEPSFELPGLDQPLGKKVADA